MRSGASDYCTDLWRGSVHRRLGNVMINFVLTWAAIQWAAYLKASTLATESAR